MSTGLHEIKLENFMKKIFIAILVLIFLSACSSTMYHKVTKDEEVTVSNVSLGMERKDVDMAFKKGDEIDASVKIGSSNGKDSFNKAADALIEAGNSLKGFGASP